MKKYEVIITQTLERTVVIEATSEDEAEKYALANIELDMDYVDCFSHEASAYDIDQNAEVDYTVI